MSIESFLRSLAESLAADSPVCGCVDFYCVAFADVSLRDLGLHTFSTSRDLESRERLNIFVLRTHLATVPNGKTRQKQVKTNDNMNVWRAECLQACLFK